MTMHRNPLLIVAALAVSTATFAGGVDTFGSPIVKRAAPENVAVTQDHRVIQNLPVVTQVERQLAAVTAANASGAQVVTLPYGEHKTYAIPLRQGMFVTFVLPKDEPIKQFAVSDPGAVQLNVSQETNTAMLKLVTSVTVVGTIVTAKRPYYIEISPAARNAPWYQGVSWSYGVGSSFGSSTFTEGVFSVTGAAPAVSGRAGTSAPSLADPISDIYTGTPNFDYAIKGDASFRPVSVWDNGRFTWIQFRKDLQELPALFVDGPNGLEIANYTVHAGGTQLLVNRLMPAFVLKIGKASIRVEAGR